MSNKDQPCQSTEEFVGLFSRYSLRIYGYIRTLVPNYQDANDVFQNTSCVLWKKYDQYSPNTNFFAWACRIARFEVLAHYRKKSYQHIFTEAVLDALTSEVAARSDQLEVRSEALANCLQKLPAGDKGLVEARYQQGSKMADIAKNLSMSLATVYRALNKIHDQLFRCVERSISREV